MGLDDTQQKVLTDLKRKRGVVKASLTRIRKLVNTFHIREDAITLLEFRPEELVADRKFDDIQCRIKLIDVDNAGKSDGKRKSRKLKRCADIQELINVEKARYDTVHNSWFSSANRSRRTQLPPVPLPTFNGDIQDWFSFFDVFRAMVHNDDNYSVAQKFFYLRSCLKGPAMDLVRSVPVNDVNYEVVIQRLIQRYDNPSLVMQSHIRSILECPSVEEKSPGSLRKFHATVCTHIAALKSLKQPVDHWDAWLITMVTSRLDKSTAQAWQLHQQKIELPKYVDFEVFLAKRCKNKAIRPCACCSKKHMLFTCKRFISLSITERLGLAREKRLCFNCLCPYHTAKACETKYSCKLCNLKHNSLLHFEHDTEVGTHTNGVNVLHSRRRRAH